MSLSILLLIIALVLFATTYFTKRRFGVLGLALAAGSMLETLWTPFVTAFIKGAGVELLTPPLSSIVASVLVMIPATLVLFSGPSYSKKWQRLVGSGAFSVLAILFLLTPFKDLLVTTDASMQVYAILTANAPMIITVGLGYALYDVLTHKTIKKKDDKH